MKDFLISRELSLCSMKKSIALPPRPIVPFELPSKWVGSGSKKRSSFCFFVVVCLFFVSFQFLFLFARRFAFVFVVSLWRFPVLFLRSVLCVAFVSVFVVGCSAFQSMSIWAFKRLYSSDHFSALISFKYFK